MLVDSEFNRILEEYLIPNEGGYNNDTDDSGGETNMGISKATHKNENIKKLTRERANAIYYRDYYNWNGLNKLPYQIRGFIVDFGALSSPETAIKITHKVLGIPEGNIIGDKTLNKLILKYNNHYINCCKNIFDRWNLRTKLFSLITKDKEKKKKRRIKKRNNKKLAANDKRCRN
mgnify:CR=1 FL=1